MRQLLVGSLFVLVVSGCVSGRSNAGGPSGVTCSSVCAHVLPLCEGLGVDSATCNGMCADLTAAQRSCAASASTCESAIACADTTGDPCSTTTSCSTCAGMLGCGFCTASGTCLTGGPSAPTDTSCASGWIWEATSCGGGCDCDTTTACTSGCACDPECSTSVIGTRCSCDPGPGIVSCAGPTVCSGGDFECLSYGTTTGICTYPCTAEQDGTRCEVGGLCSSITYNGDVSYRCL
ncbi:MAG: hypothetical protein IPK60_08095 [Sandaracinaceae bacterium]|nr:hypothetical protein [Sandaracinaceae bacterium]